MGSSAELSAFLDFLSEELNFRFNKDSFEDRLKFQKYVYFAKSFGCDLGYSFSRYIRGPYSTALAHDYYSMDSSTELRRLPSSFDSERFLNLVRGKKPRWLELASTLHLFYGEMKGKSNDVPRDSLRMTSNVKTTEVSRLKPILRELEASGLMA